MLHLLSYWFPRLSLRLGSALAFYFIRSSKRLTSWATIQSLVDNYSKLLAAWTTGFDKEAFAEFEEILLTTFDWVDTPLHTTNTYYVSDPLNRVCCVYQFHHTCKKQNNQYSPRRPANYFGCYYSLLVQLNWAYIYVCLLRASNSQNTEYWLGSRYRIWTCDLLVMSQTR